MPGFRIPIIRPTRFDFSFLSGGASMTVPLARGIDISSAMRIQLYVRIHTSRWSMSGLGLQTVVVAGRQGDPSSADAAPYVAPSNLIEVTVKTPDVFQANLMTASKNTGGVAFLDLLLTANQRPMFSDTLEADLSVDLLLRDKPGGAEST